MLYNNLCKVLLGIICSSFCLVSCSTYPSKFKCGDARGLGCTMLSEIDKQINNGKIVEAYKEKKCKTDYCQNQEDTLTLRNSGDSVIYIKDSINKNDNGFEEKDYRYVFE